MIEIEKAKAQFEQFVDNDYVSYAVPSNDAVNLALEVLQEKAEREKTKCDNCEYIKCCGSQYPCCCCTNCYINQFKAKSGE